MVLNKSFLGTRYSYLLNWKVLYWKVWEDDSKFDIEKNKNIEHVLLVIIIWARLGAVFEMTH